MRKLLSIVTASLIFGLMAPVVAASTPASPSTPGLGLEIGPPLVELSGDPGQTINVNISVRNVTSTALIVTPQSNNFGAKDETGDPAILFNDPATRYSLKTWFQLPSPFQLAPGELRKLTIPVALPGNAEPGGHYGVVRFSATPAAAGGQAVSLGASVGTLVLVKVNGPIKEQMGVEEFYVASKDGHKSSFFQQGPIEFTERLKNSGTIHETPSGYVDVYNMAGKKVTTLPVNPNPQQRVLPDQIHKFTQEYNKPWLIGRYKADLNMIYGSNNQTLHSTVYFWVLPLRLLLLWLVGIILAIVIIVWLIRRYNRYIVKRARRG